MEDWNVCLLCPTTPIYCNAEEVNTAGKQTSIPVYMGWYGTTRDSLASIQCFVYSTCLHSIPSFLVVSPISSFLLFTSPSFFPPVSLHLSLLFSPPLSFLFPFSPFYSFSCKLYPSFSSHSYIYSIKYINFSIFKSFFPAWVSLVFSPYFPLKPLPFTRNNPSFLLYFTHSTLPPSSTVLYLPPPSLLQLLPF